ncbi:hypothetical protein [Streptomyces sp. NBC_00038]|uniref:hypothetical protein n=1 Tax=Streptomyces sp. NBC_00038 TaxID=2903615 RepID=UPI002255276E|nr:hypothetical protein [Streptomyces sp. NBC_00038]MCX5557536.1 hypothetical protein [Streptomyces sp. NBC_00038]
MSRTPFRRRYWDSLVGRGRAGRPYVRYRPTEESPLWRRYLVSLLGVPRAPRPAPRPRVRATRRLPLALALAAVAAAVVLGGSTFAAFQTGSDRDIGGGPITSTAQTVGGDGGTVGGGGPGGSDSGGSTQGTPSADPTERPPTAEPAGTLGPPSPPPTDPVGELPSTGAPTLLLTASLGLFLLALGAVGLHLTRTRSRTVG